MTTQRKSGTRPCVPDANPRDDFPFLDGDFFEGLCTRSASDADLSQLTRDDLLYCETHNLPGLFARLARENFDRDFRLLSHNSDATIRRAPDGRFLLHLGLGINPTVTPLEVPANLRQWFGQNLDIPNDDRLHSLPIGLERRRWSGGLKHQILARLSSAQVAPEHLLYVNHAGNTNPERRGLAERLAPHAWCHVSGKVSFLDYCLGILRSRFVLSPDGNGMDCHRTWEALYLGRIPVMRRSAFHEAVYLGLPIVLVDS